MPADGGAAATATDDLMAAPQNPQLAAPSLKGLPHVGQKLIAISSCFGLGLHFSSGDATIRCQLLALNHRGNSQVADNLLGQRLDFGFIAWGGHIHKTKHIVVPAKNQSGPYS